MRSVVIHGHFYQPPREDPWTGVVELEPTAAPFHDWNQRIESECYAPVANARVLDGDGSVAYTDNLYAELSFNVGPTLFEWMESSAPDTYAAILEADAISEKKLGHGNAIGMPYHHIILPLASRRDKVTEVRWGIADFRRRFGRDPEGMWLPETAVDPETLDVLAEAGILFTILAPHQVENPPADGMPLRYVTTSGDEIALFIYDGRLAGDMAFGPLLRDGAVLARRLAGTEGDGIALESAAMDGETFGHHQKFGEMGLARAFRIIGEDEDIRLENFSSFLERNPPLVDAVLVSPTSWSCPHGVERWRAECGCKLSPEQNTSQAWRKPLRESFDWLAGELHKIFEAEGKDLFNIDPWEVRDRAGDLIGSSEASALSFVADSVTRRDGARIERAAELLEMENGALRMFTSCAWFFDDVARIETIQALRYAAFAIELSGDAARLEAGLMERVGDVRSNDPAEGTVRDIWRAKVKPHDPADVVRA
jgi:Alpha-amylase/alpha-mannosidase